MPDRAKVIRALEGLATYLDETGPYWQPLMEAIEVLKELERGKCAANLEAAAEKVAAGMGISIDTERGME